MNEEKCRFCDSTELVYYPFQALCQKCGEWQNEETI